MGIIMMKKELRILTDLEILEAIKENEKLTEAIVYKDTEFKKDDVYNMKQLRLTMTYDRNVYDCYQELRSRGHGLRAILSYEL